MTGPRQCWHGFRVGAGCDPAVMQKIADWWDRQASWQDCSARLTLPTPLAAELEDLEGSHEIRPVVGCELELGHDGPHASLGQADVIIDGAAAADRWAVWTTVEDARVIPAEACRAEILDMDGEEAGCPLPTGHAGPHVCLGPAAPGDRGCVLQRWSSRA